MANEQLVAEGAAGESGAAGSVRPVIAAPHVAGLDLASGFRAPWKRVWRSPGYRVALIAVAFTMFLVPVIYLAMVGGLGYALYLHAVHDLKYVGSVHGRAAVFALGLYAAPLLAGVVVILFLLRPVLLVFAGRPAPVSLDPHEEPAVFAFVEAICREIGAPVPKRIDVTGEPNASASFRQGLLSVIIPGDLVLTIGMPLVTGLRLNQFAGVLAHELGHFSQGAGMRANYMTAVIGSWLHAAAYGQDELGAIARSQLQSEHSRFKVIAFFVLIGTWVSRLLLRVLLSTVGIVGCVMLRRMEFDADRHEVRLVGSKESIVTTRRILEINEAFAGCLIEVRDFWNNDQLPDDLPALVGVRSEAITGEQAAAVRKQLEHGKTAFFDTHPSHAARIKFAERLNEEGIFNLDQPATVLFRDVHAAGKKASYAFYREAIGPAFSKATFVSTEGVVREARRHGKRLGVVAKYLGFEPPAWRPFFPSMTRVTGADDPKKTLAALKEARARTKEAGSQVGDAPERFRKADEEMVACDQAKAAFDLGLAAAPSSLKIPHRSRRGVSDVRQRAVAEAASASALMDQAMDDAATRLSAALRLLHSAGMEGRIGEAPRLRERSKALLAASATLRELLPMIAPLRAEIGQARIAAEHGQRTGKVEDAKKVLRPLSDTVRDRLGEIRRVAGGTPYPFEHPSGEINFGERLVGATPAWREFDQIFPVVEMLLERYPEDARRVYAELIEIGAMVESALSGAGAARTAQDGASVR